MLERIGLYGGSFNPIHNGHLIVARHLAEALKLDRVILLPTATPPHKQPDETADARHLGEMIRLAVEGDPLFEYSDYDLTRPGPTFTIDTVEHFRGRIGPAGELYWLIGADSLAELITWKSVDELVTRCNVATARRPGAGVSDWASLTAKIGAPAVDAIREHMVETPLIDISSTDIRNRIRSRLSIRYLLPDAVRAYIEGNGLYR